MLIGKYPQYKQWANEDLSPKDSDKRIIMEIQPIKKDFLGFCFLIIICVRAQLFLAKRKYECFTSYDGIVTLNSR